MDFFLQIQLLDTLGNLCFFCYHKSLEIIITVIFEYNGHFDA